jgi:hypothetical protein
MMMYQLQRFSNKYEKMIVYSELVSCWEEAFKERPNICLEELKESIKDLSG